MRWTARSGKHKAEADKPHQVEQKSLPLLILSHSPSRAHRPHERCFFPCFGVSSEETGDKRPGGNNADSTPVHHCTLARPLDRRSPCAGKTSIADRLAQSHGLHVYHFDRTEREHIARRIAEGDSALAAFLSQSMDQRWLMRKTSVMAQSVIGFWTERFRQVLEDLLVQPKDPGIIAEGPGLFPECVFPCLSDLQQAIWLVPTDAFCTTVRQYRHSAGIDGFHQTSDPERALRQLIERDGLLARYVKQRAEALYLPLYEVDGSHSLDEMTRLVEQHFAPLLPPSKKQEGEGKNDL
jgi:hypothetical protein